MLRKPCSVKKVYVTPLWTFEDTLNICTEKCLKKLVLETVYGSSTHAQNSRMEAGRSRILVVVKRLMCWCVLKRANNSRITPVYILFKCMNIVYLCFILDNLECIAPSHSFLMLELIFLVLVMAWLTQKLFLWSNKVYYIRLKIWLNKDPVQSFTMEIDRKRREQSNPEKYRTVLSKLSLGLKGNCIVAKQIFSE